MSFCFSKKAYVKLRNKNPDGIQKMQATLKIGIFDDGGVGIQAIKSQKTHPNRLARKIRQVLLTAVSCFCA